VCSLASNRPRVSPRGWSISAGRTPRGSDSIATIDPGRGPIPKTMRRKRCSSRFRGCTHGKPPAARLELTHGQILLRSQGSRNSSVLPSASFGRDNRMQSPFLCGETRWVQPAN
jgi:hypothetical protein